MAAVTIRDLSDEAHRVLKDRAARHNRSAEAEMRCILEAAAIPEEPVGMGTAMAEIGRKHDISNADVDALKLALEQYRDRQPAEPIRFE